MTATPKQDNTINFIEVHDLENRVAETVAKVSNGQQEFVITQNGKTGVPLNAIRTTA